MEVLMENNDTEYLLKECDAGVKMAVSSIDEVLDKVSDSNMKQLLINSKNHHDELKSQIHHLLQEQRSEEKEPNPLAKGMSWLKTNMKMTLEESDATIAGLITDGCHMGVKSLNQYYNQYKKADQVSKDICKELISIEDHLEQSLRPYL